MKQIIKGKRFDTETSTKVADFWNGYGWSDFKYINETLYLGKEGSWFLHAQGGAMTEYADYHGNSKSNGERIISLTSDEAAAWLEKYNHCEALEKHFADRIGDA